MAPTWLVGFYAPVKDLVQMVASRRPPKISLCTEAHSLGTTTWVTVTAEYSGKKPVFIRGCYIDIYVHSFESCAEPYPVRTRSIVFRPGGKSTLSADGQLVRWETHISNEHLLRAERELNEAEAVTTYGKRAPEILKLQKKVELASQTRQNWLVHRMLRALSGPESAKIRVVIESGDGKELATRDVTIPPIAPLAERLTLTYSILKSWVRSRRRT